MAEFKAGDRVVKMSGFSAGKYGTVNSVLENGTLNVTFDGERLPKYCDPMRCGQVATNAVEFTNPNYRPEAGMRFLDENFSMFDPKVAKAMIEDARRKGVRVPPGVIEKARRAGLISNAARNSRALNWNYRNSYQFFCVDPSMKAPCIYSGWDYREDAKDDAAELKELGIPHKIVSRRFLEQNGIDPNDGASWKKNRGVNAARNDLRHDKIIAKAGRIAAQRIGQLESEFTELFRKRIADYVRRVRLTDAQAQELKTADVRAKASYKPGIFPSVKIAPVSRSKFAEEIAMAGGYFGTRLERWLESVWKAAGGWASDWVSTSDWATRN